MTLTTEVRERPKRIQLQRRKGWRKPGGAVVVSRPSAWGNPFKVGTHARDKAEAVAMYRTWIDQNSMLRDAARRILGGKDLCCWCGPGPCHADVLLEIANSPARPARKMEAM